MSSKITPPFLLLAVSPVLYGCSDGGCADGDGGEGDCRAESQILDIYDPMQRAIDTGEPHRTFLDPVVADSHVSHPAKETQP